jgi:hypothetical protein
MTRNALLLLGLNLFLTTALNLYSAAQDYIKENPELDRLLGDSSPHDRDALNKMLSSMRPAGHTRHQRLHKCEFAHTQLVILSNGWSCIPLPIAKRGYFQLAAVRPAETLGDVASIPSYSQVLWCSAMELTTDWSSAGSTGFTRW